MDINGEVWVVGQERVGQDKLYWWDREVLFVWSYEDRGEREQVRKIGGVFEEADDFGGDAYRIVEGLWFSCEWIEI